MRIVRVVGIACVVSLLVACSDDGAHMPATPDAAGADTGADAYRWAPEPPRIPWLAVGMPPIAPPVLTPCPPGWREVHDGEVTTCDPYPEGGPGECAEGFAHFPGGPGCEPVGSPCPAGEWSDGLPREGVLYVRAEAPDGGDGTRDRPYGHISDAMASATDGTVVALSRGRWDETITLSAGVTLQGACSAETVLTSTVSSEVQGLADVAVPRAQLRDVQIESASRPGLSVRGVGAELHVEGVIVSGVRVVGVVVAVGAHLTPGITSVEPDSRSARTKPGSAGA